MRSGELNGSTVRPRRARLLAGVALVAAVLAAGCGSSSGRIDAVGTPSDLPQTEGTVGDRSAASGIDVDGSLPQLPDDGDDPAIGEQLPTLSGPGLDGETVEVGPGDGPQLVVFVAHWCPHCQREVPQLVAAMADGTIPRSVRVTAVSTAVDEIRGNYPPVSWLAEEGWPTPVLADDETTTAAAAFGVSGFPFIVAADAEGRVVARTAGELTPADYEQLVQLVTAS